MSQRTSEPGAAVERKETRSILATSLRPSARSNESIGAHEAEFASDEEIEGAFAALTSERPPPPSDGEGDDQNVEVGDIKELAAVASAAPRVEASPSWPAAPEPRLPRPRAVTLLGLAPPSTGERVPRTTTFPPAPRAHSSLPPQADSTRPSGADVSTVAPVRGPSSRQAPVVTQRPPGQATDIAASSFLNALRAHVLFAGGVVPLWAVVAILVLPLILAGVLIGAGTSVRKAEALPARTAAGSGSAMATASTAAVASAAAPAVVASAACPNPAPVAAQAPLVEVQGAAGMVDVIERANARLLRETAAAEQFAGVLAREPTVIEQPAVLAEFRQHIARPHSAPLALGAVAAMPGTLGADLLYEVWTGKKVRSDTTELARELVYSREVRAKASPALNVALDLRVAKGCEEQRSLLLRAGTDGDRRALPSLAKLLNDRGCGPTKRDDCYACLRKSRELTNAINGAKNRRVMKRLFMF